MPISYRKLIHLQTKRRFSIHGGFFKDIIINLMFLVYICGKGKLYEKVLLILWVYAFFSSEWKSIHLKINCLTLSFLYFFFF